MKYYVVDAFADQLFSGNPAGVCLLDQPIHDSVMQKIAAENNLSETAFLQKMDDYYSLRWFTPAVEVNLCGHATLASAFVIFNFVEPKATEMRFFTKSGLLGVTRKGDLLELDFPSRKPSPVPVTSLMEEALGVSIKEAHFAGAHSANDLMLLLESEEYVKNLTPDFTLISKIPDCRGVIVTAKGKESDFVSRFFAPGVGIPEDPVTGSAHTILIPFWSERLGKKSMVARQLSARSGTLYCEDIGERVHISGRAALYLTGELPAFD